MSNLFTITQKSLDIHRNVVSKMSGNSMHHHLHFLYDLRSEFKGDDVTYLEIGTFHGGSVSLMLQHPDPLKCICIDPCVLPGQEAHINTNIERFNVHKNKTVKLYKEYSTSASLIQEFYLSNLKIDILFIDGDHAYNTVISDFENFYPFVKSGGYIVFDDYNDFHYSPEVHGAVDEVVRRIWYGKYGDKSKFNIIGQIPNLFSAYPAELKQGNEFVVRVV
jgi:cephalosporin hydroxylase